MKWVARICLVLALMLLPTTVSAATSAEVTIYAMGYVCDAPGGFTLTYITDYEIGINWAMGAGANNTMVRAAYGRYPENRTDGYLVYYGNGTYCNDTAVNLDETASLVYYRAWSQNAAGVWEEVGASDWLEGPNMKMIALIVLCLGLMTPAFLWKKQALMVAAGLAWTVLAFWSRAMTPTWGTWDMYELLFYLGFALALMCFIESAVVAHRLTLEDRAELEAEKAREGDPYIAEFRRYSQEISDYGAQFKREPKPQRAPLTRAQKLKAFRDRI